MTIYKNIEKFYDWYDKYSNNEFKTYDNEWLKEILRSELDLVASNQGNQDVIYELPALESVTGHPETYNFKQTFEEIEPDNYQVTFIF